MNRRFRRLFEPFQIGGMTLKNRIVMPAMGTNLAAPDGYITEPLKEHYEERARGGAGLIIVESTCVDFPRGKNIARAPSADGDQFLPGLTQLAQAIQQHGARAALQLNHGGRHATARFTGLEPVAPSAIAMPGGERPREITLPEVEQIIASFAKAAERAKKAGFSGVEVHSAHDYLLSEFLSRATNKRKDRYGGNLENRARLLLEIIQAIRALVGKDYPLWCRLDGSQYGVAEGLTLEESREVARMIQAAGVNAIHVSAYGEGIHCLSTTPDSPGYLVPLAEGIKRAVSVPVIAVGRLDPQLGETILKNGQADLITMGRRLIADPDLPRKAASGKFEEIVPCTACLHCVDAIMIQGDEVHCRINALARKTGEYKIKPAEKAKRVMVVGGGPAGMEAARVASQRGHEVTLYEKARRLGGKLILASVLDEEKDSIIRYLSGQMKNLGVKVETGREVTPSLISESRPDVLILATGAAPLLPEIKGIEGKKVVSPAAIQGMASGHLKGGISINRPWIERVLWHLGSLVFRFMSPFRIASLTKLWLPFGKKVVVMGGNMAGCQLADFLTERGRRVTLLELTARFASDMLVLPRYVLLDRLTRKEVVMWKGLKEYKEITERGLVVITKDLKEQVIDADTIIPNLASLPHTELFKAMEGKVPEIYSAGDCQGSSLILEAVRDGFRIGRSI